MKTIFIIIFLILVCSTPAVSRNASKTKPKKPTRTKPKRTKSKKPKSKSKSKGESYKKLPHSFGDHIAIANRGGGTISLVDPHSLKTAVEYTLPDEGEPMYFACSKDKNEIWVGDRKNNRLVILNMKGSKLELDGFIDLPQGVFHSMITQSADEAYPIVVTTCDIDNVITAHDLTTRRLLATMERPQQAADAGSKPHDVTTNGKHIFVTFLGTEKGFVASYDAYTFELVAVLETEADPHVAIRDDTSLFIAAQGGDDPGFVIKASVPDLEVMSTTERPSPHGMFISFDSKYLYTTNIGGEGVMAVEVWNVADGGMKDCPAVMTKNPVPHNPVVSFDGDMIVITHSGATSKVNSAFDIRSDGCIKPGSERTFETNLNPFGLFIIPPPEAQCQCPD